jgi:hypothetical protein
VQSGAIRCNQVQSGRRAVRVLVHQVRGVHDQGNQHAISMQSACNQHAISMQSEVITRYEEYTTVGDFVKSGCVAMP